MTVKVGVIPETIDMTIPCQSDYVGVVRLTVSGIASRLNFSVEDIEDLKIAVSEACTNAVQYAYDDESGRISITVNRYDDRLEVVVEDTGRGFDVAEALARDPDEVQDPDKLGMGLGLTFIKQLTHDADIQSEIGKGTRIQMVKRVGSA